MKWWAMAACACLVACDPPAPPPATVSSAAPVIAASASASVAPSAWAAPSPPVPAEPAPTKPVTLGFVGDMALSLLVGHWIDKRDAGKKVPAGIDATYPFTHVREALGKPDVMIGNLECVVSKKGVKSTDHNPFRAPLSTPRILLDAGFDVVSVANNHARDFGKAGFDDMLENLRAAKLPYVGAESYGRKPAALHTRTIRGVRIGLLSYYIITASLPVAKRDIAAAREKVDVVVVFNHWGLEGHQEPANGQEKWAPALIEAGANLVVGAHAHVLQGEQWFAREKEPKALVFYGLGNFVFTGQGYDALHATGGFLEVDVNRRGVVARRFRRIKLDDQGAPRFLDDAPVEPCSVIPCPR